MLNFVMVAFRICRVNTQFTGAVVLPKGIYVPPGKDVPRGEKKLHLIFEGPTEQSVKNAKIEVKKVLEQYSGVTGRPESTSNAGTRYSVM